MFREKFSVPRALFKRLLEDLIVHDPGTWEARRDAVGRAGIAAEVKVSLLAPYVQRAIVAGTGRCCPDGPGDYPVVLPKLSQSHEGYRWRQFP